MLSLDDRLGFLELGAQERQVLRGFRPVLEAEIDSLLERFYRKILGVPDLAAKFRNDAAVRRARAAQREHWMRLFSAEFDDAYYQSVREIGRTHSRIGLEPRWYIGGYAFVLAELATLAERSCRSRWFSRRRPDALPALLSVISRVVMLDTELALSVYLDEEKAAHDRFVEQLSSDFGDSVVTIVRDLVREAQQIGGGAGQLHRAAETAKGQACTVADATEQTNANVQTVAAALEEMSVSVREISSHLSRQVTISADAMRAGETADHHARGLDACADRIGAAVGLIKDIASQTNLLALNATIEAARAGEMGKGFAVVAGEVNALAGQVTRATADIQKLVDEVRAVVVDTVQAIAEMNATIMQMDQSTGAIASAVEQQSAATQTIAENVQEAARSTQTVSDAISRVRDVVGQTEAYSDTTRAGVETLNGRAGQLSEKVSGFVQKLLGRGGSTDASTISEVGSR